MEYYLLCRKIEGSRAMAKPTAELLRSVISQQRVPNSNQAAALIDAVKAVGEQLIIAANPLGMLLACLLHKIYVKRFLIYKI